MPTVTINCPPAAVVDLARRDVATYGNQQFLYDYPPLQQLPYQGLTDYYWCAAEVVRLWLLGGGFDLRSIVRQWAYVPALYDLFDALPEFPTVYDSATGHGARSDVRAGDVIVFSQGSSRYHIGITGDWTATDTPTFEGDTSSPAFPGSDSTGGVMAARHRTMDDNETGGYSVRVWRPPYVVPTTKDNQTGDLTGSQLSGLARIFHQADQTEPGVVAALQYHLNTYHGAQLAVDGSFGPLTIRSLQALLNYALHVGLELDGQFGPLTSAALDRQVAKGTI